MPTKSNQLATVLLLLCLASPAVAGGPAPVTCPEIPHFAVSLDLARELGAGPSDPAWRAACAAARDANMRRKAIVARVLRGGEQPGEAYPSTARFVRLSRAASDADHTTLFRLVAHDQAARESLSRQAKQLFGPNLDPLASAILDGVIAREAVEADAASRAWLRAAVAHRGWFRIPSDGEDADLAAWLIVQHGDADRAFQEAMIRLLAPLAAAGETSALRFAFLYDRWAAGAGQPQRYGLQGRCVAAGVWRPLPIAEPDTLEARRRAAGFAETFDQFVAKERKACPAASPAGP